MMASLAFTGFGDFGTVLKLVSGSLLGDEWYGDVYLELDNPTDGVAHENFRSTDIHANSSGVHAAFKANIPTVSGVARLVE